MALYAFHRVLIVFAILFDFAFTVFCIRRYNRSGGALDLVWAALASFITVAFVYYLVLFNRKVNRLRITLAARAVLCPRCEYDLRGSLATDTIACPECGEPITDEFRRKAAAAA